MDIFFHRFFAYARIFSPIAGSFLRDSQLFFPSSEKYFFMIVSVAIGCNRYVFLARIERSLHESSRVPTVQ